METKTFNLSAEAAKNGVIWGVINIVLFLAVYYLAFTLMTTMWYGAVNIVIGILLAVYFCKDLRTKAGGYWTFSTALKNIAIMFVTSALLLHFFSLAFGKFIDKDYPVKMKEIIMASTEKMMNNISQDEAVVSEAMRSTEERLNGQFDPTFSQLLVGVGIVIIMWFIGALIFAAIFKKQPPMFIEEEEVQFPASS